MTEIAKVSSLRCGLGEGPLWHPQRQQLFVTDVFAKMIHILDEDLNCLRSIACDRIVTAMTWAEDGAVMLFHDQGAISRMDTEDNIYTILSGLPEEAQSRFNDVIADPIGRVLAGTEPTEDRLGRLYLIDNDLEWRIVLDDVKEPNGLGFSKDNKRLYFTDSVRQKIWQFDYDIDSGVISNQRCLFQCTDDTLPDGLTVDNHDNIWAALWDGGQILCIDPKGILLHRVYLPARLTSSITYGGANMESIFVTSARDDLARDKRLDFDGAIFRVDKCGCGRPEFPSRILPK